MARIVIIEANDLLRQVMVGLLVARGHEAVGAGSARSGLRRLRSGRTDLVLTDQAGMGPGSASPLANLREEFPSMPVVHVGGARFLAPAVPRGAGASGICYSLARPFTSEEFIRVVEQALGMGSGR